MLYQARQIHPNYFKAAQWGLAENVDFFDINSSHYVSQFKFRGTVVLPGILSMGYFRHDCDSCGQSYSIIGLILRTFTAQIWERP